MSDIPPKPVDPPRPRTDPVAGAETDTDTPTVANARLVPPSTTEVFPALGDYAILQKIGEGGMGAVYLAEDTKLKRRAAIKTMRSELASRKGDRDRFLREAQAAAAVESDYIVPVWQIGEAADGTPFLAMPFLQGESLDARLKRDPVAPLALLVKVAREVAEGLAAAHEIGLIHRDIKPGNIWLEGDLSAKDPARQVRRCKILDFGLARLVDGGDAHLTASGAIVGTPAYMAPEQARGEHVDCRADLFSLGVTLYRAATGKPPFKGNSAMAVLTALATETPKPVHEFAPDLPPALAELIHRLISKDPAQRPSSAAEVIEALARIGTERPSAPASNRLPAGLESTGSFPPGAVALVSGSADTIAPAADATSVPAPVAIIPSAARALLTELISTFALVAVVAVVCAVPWAAYPSPGRWTLPARAFVLTAALSWAVALAGWLPQPGGRFPWLQRAIQLTIGLGIGMLAFWCDGWTYNALEDAPASEVVTLNDYRIGRDSLWTTTRYVLYFGAVVALCRWWSATDRQRAWRVRFTSFLMAAVWSAVFLPLWPRHSAPLGMGVAVIVAATLAVQIASPRKRLALS